MHPWGGAENNSPVVQFLALILLVAAVKIRFRKTVVQNIAFLKPPKVVQKIALQHMCWRCIYREREGERQRTETEKKGREDSHDKSQRWVVRNKNIREGTREGERVRKCFFFCMLAIDVLFCYLKFVLSWFVSFFLLMVGLIIQMKQSVNVFVSSGVVVFLCSVCGLKLLPSKMKVMSMPRFVHLSRFLPLPVALPPHPPPRVNISDSNVLNWMETHRRLPLGEVARLSILYTPLALRGGATSCGVDWRVRVTVL